MTEDVHKPHLARQASTFSRSLASAKLKLHSQEARKTRECTRNSVRQTAGRGPNGRRSSVTGLRESKSVSLLDALNTTAAALSRSRAAAALIGLRVRGQQLSLRQQIFLVLEEPFSSLSAYIVSIVIRATLVLAAATSTCETVEALTDHTGTTPWLIASVALNAILTLEAVVRVMCYEPSRVAALRDAFVWLDVICILPLWVRFLVFPQLTSLPRSAGAMRVFVALASVRLLKLCRYYEGAALLALALHRSIEQLHVPLFMLLIMVIAFSTLLFTMELSPIINDCKQWWVDAGVAASFLRAHPEGVTWGCDVCNHTAVMTDRAADLCATCVGWPPGHPECASVPFEQEFASVPAAMWFLLVTITTVGYGDQVPK